MSAPALRLDGVGVRYGEVVALDDVTLRLDPGRVCGLIGVNGSGKSTLMRAVMGLVRAGRGDIEVDGRSPQEARRAGVLSYVPQHEQVDWSFPISVREVVMTGRYGHQGAIRRPTARDRDLVDEALDRVGLTDLADRQIGRLSGGQRKRTFVARGIAQQARVLLLDEPFAGVDKTSEAAVTALLRALAADGRTVLVASHDLHAIPTLCDEVVLLRGRILAHGAVADVLTPDRLSEVFGLTADGPDA